MPSKKRSKSNKKLEQQITSIFKRFPNEQFSSKQLIRKIKSNTPRSFIAQTIVKLLNNGIIIEKNQKLSLATTKKDHQKKKLGDKTYIGKVDMKPRGIAYILVDELDSDIYVSNKDTNKALNGDTVEVVLFKNQKKKNKLSGQITNIIKRAKELFIGTIQLSKNNAFLICDDTNMPVDLYISKNKINDAKDGQKVVAKMYAWPDGMKSPLAEVVEILGAPGSNDVEMKSILIEKGFNSTFDNAVIQEAEHIDGKILDSEIKKRKDYRPITTFTIDPEDAKDFDDALSIRQLTNKNWEIGIHIADVSHFVKENSLLDREALERGNSVYLVDRVIPMLPEKLSNGVCSLRPNEDKYCFSAIFEMDEQANIKKEWFGKTIINSDKRFSYEAAQGILEKKAGAFSKELVQLNKLAYILRAEKFKNGAIAFESTEVRFKLDHNGKPVGIETKERKDAHMLIEDFILLANKKVATYVSKIQVEQKQIGFIYRVHDYPDTDKLADFGKMANMFGYKIDVSNLKSINKQLNRLMEDIKGKPEQDMLERMAIRCMAKAVYSPKNIGHYGLAFSHYTHFTSPIRRYADLHVHRTLHEILNKTGHYPTMQATDKICVHISDMERKAMEAERDSIKYKQVEYMMDKHGEIFNAIISGIIEWGIFVEVIENKCEGLVKPESLDDDFYFYNQEKMCFEGKEYGHQYKLGDPVKVKVKNTNLSRKQIDFEIVV